MNSEADSGLNASTRVPFAASLVLIQVNIASADLETFLWSVLHPTADGSPTADLASRHSLASSPRDSDRSSYRLETQIDGVIQSRGAQMHTCNFTTRH